jgi:hypothetical protein
LRAENARPARPEQQPVAWIAVQTLLRSPGVGPSVHCTTRVVAAITTSSPWLNVAANGNSPLGYEPASLTTGTTKRTMARPTCLSIRRREVRVADAEQRAEELLRALSDLEPEQLLVRLRLNRGGR